MPARLPLTRPISREQLKTHYRRAKDARVKIRLQMLLRAKEGVSARQIAREVHLTHGTVIKWIRRFNKEGLDGLTDRGRTGRSVKVTPSLLQKILRRPPSYYSYQAPTWTPRLVRALLATQFQIHYKLSSIYRVLRRCGFSLITPRSKHYKQRPKQLQAFKKT